jgi:hypothetical protein
MPDKYKKSRELKPKENVKKEENNEDDVTLTEEEITSILDITENKELNNVELNGTFWWRDSFFGKAKNGMIIQSDFNEQIKNVEEITRKNAVGFCILEDGSVMVLVEDI